MHASAAHKSGESLSIRVAAWKERVHAETIHQACARRANNSALRENSVVACVSNTKSYLSDLHMVTIPQMCKQIAQLAHLPSSSISSKRGVDFMPLGQVLVSITTIPFLPVSVVVCMRSHPAHLYGMETEIELFVSMSNSHRWEDRRVRCNGCRDRIRLRGRVLEIASRPPAVFWKGQLAQYEHGE